MKLFECQSCGHPLYFENTKCERCHHQTGYLPGLEVVSAVEPEGDKWVALADRSKLYRYCANWELHACNWMVEADSATPLCRACQHNRTIPDLSDPARFALWRRMEEAKRRLIYSLIKLKLPTPSLASGDQEPLVFDFLADAPERKVKVMTGHDDGIITISLAEADDAAREKLRTSLHEPYRTLLGHFRHEVGHFYWDKLVRDGGRAGELPRRVRRRDARTTTKPCRRYYAERSGAELAGELRLAPTPPCIRGRTSPRRGRTTCTSSTRWRWRMRSTSRSSPRVAADEGLSATVDRNPYKAKNVETLIGAWLPLTFAVNSLNRSMGQPDLYPFVISAPAVAKLQYIHDLIHGKLPKRADAPTPPPASSQRASEQAARPALRQKLSAVARRLLGGEKERAAQ